MVDQEFPSERQVHRGGIQGCLYQELGDCVDQQAAHRVYACGGSAHVPPMERGRHDDGALSCTRCECA